MERDRMSNLGSPLRQGQPAGHARVLAAWDETASLRALRLLLEGEVRAGDQPGQALLVSTPVGEAYFAVASAPGKEEVELLVKGGPAVATALIAQAAVGETVQLSGPFGPGFDAGQARGRDVLLFAAG